MKKYTGKIRGLMLAMLIAMVTLMSSCKDDDPEPDGGSDLTITAIEPSTARVGEDIVITGTGFNADFSQNTVQFTSGSDLVTANGILKEGNETSLTVEVPEGAKSGPIKLTANGETITSSMNFTLNTSLGAPVLTSLSPTNGFPGAAVVITGENFGEGIEAIEVKFGETVAVVSEVTNTTITTNVPESMAAGEVQVSVSREGTSGDNTLSFTVNEIPVDVKTVYWTAKTGDAGIFKGAITESGVEITKLYALETVAQTPKGIAVDAGNEAIYWTGGRGLIVRGSTDGEAEEETLYDGDAIGGYRFEDIAIDVQNQNIYVAATNTSDETYIMKGSLDGTAELTPIYAFPLVLNYETFYNEGVVPESVKLYVDGGKLYWTTAAYNTDYIAVMEGSLDGSTEAVVLFDHTDGLEGPRGIAFDFATSKIYIADSPAVAGATAAGTIYSGNLDGSGDLTTVVEPGDNVNLPIDMEIDLENGYIFWMNTILDNGGAAEIMRSSLDGSSVEQLFDGFDNPGYFDIEIGEVLPE